LVGQGRVEEMDAVERVLHRAVLDFKVPGNAMPQKKGAVIGSRPPASRDGFVSMDTLPIGVPPEAMPRGGLEPRASIEQEPACALPRRVDGVRGVFDGQIAKDNIRTVRHPHGCWPASLKAQGLEGNPGAVAKLQLRLIGDRVDARVEG